MKRLLLAAALLACGSGAGTKQQSVVVGHVELKPLEPARAVVGPREIVRMPLEDAIPIYRQWAQDGDVEAIAQLAWAGDTGGLVWMTKALGSPDTRLVAARALTELGDSSAMPMLRAALTNATGADRAAILWALVVLRDESIVDEAIREYASGALEKVTLLDEERAFELERLAMLCSPAKAATLASSDDIATRNLGLVALTLQADTAPPPAVVSALENSDKDSWEKLVDLVGQGAGGKGLVLLLSTVSRPSVTRDREKFRTKSIFERLRARPDPRAVDALARYLDTKPEPHWRTEAAFRLAELGDMRALPSLAWRLEQDPLKLYSDLSDPEFRRDDNERVVAARLLAELAVIHPDQRAELRKVAYSPVRAWLTQKPQPHANGLRFLAAAEVKEALPLLRNWANPKMPLPKAGQQDFPAAWATAQTALRYLGATKDASSWSILESQLNRRPEKLDATIENLLQGGVAVLGMTVRALGVGAAQGFSEWGDPRAYPLLVKFIDDPLNNEQAKSEAGAALGAVATDAQIPALVAKLRALDKATTNPEMGNRYSYIEALRLHPRSSPALFELWNEATPTLRTTLSLALGRAGLTPEVATQLRAKLVDPDLRTDAALALVLGGSTDDARYALGSYVGADPAALLQLRTAYQPSGIVWSDADYETGALARIAANAEAASHVKLGPARAEWLRSTLRRALEDLTFDNGPHSLTKVQLRARLRADASTKPAASQRVLALMEEASPLPTVTESKKTP